MNTIPRDELYQEMKTIVGRAVGLKDYEYKYMFMHLNEINVTDYNPEQLQNQIKFLRMLLGNDTPIILKG